MGDVIKLHARASVDSRAASSASFSNVTSERPLSLAAATTVDQRSAGMESRAFMVRAWESGMPIALPNLAGPPKASMTEENESMTRSLHQVAISVNTACSDFSATICRMETFKQRQGRRLKEARIAAGFKKSAAAAATAFGWAKSTYRTHEDGSRTIGQDDAEKYARAFSSRGPKITSDMILYPDGKGTGESDDSEFQRGWDAAMQAVAAAAGGGKIPPVSPLRAKKTPRKK